MQLSKLENEKASGKLNLDALKRKNYKSNTVEKPKEKLSPPSKIPASDIPVKMPSS